MDNPTSRYSVLDTPALGDEVNRYGPTSARPAKASKARPATITVDVHSHIAVPKAAEYVKPHLNMMDIAMVRHSSDETKAINMRQDQDRTRAMVDIEDRLQVLDAMRIDFQVVAPPPFQCYYSVPVEHAVPATRMVNDGIAEYVGKRPDKFAGLGTVVMQEPSEAVAELERVMGELGFKGVQILTNVNGNEISSPEYEPFWKKAEALGAVVMIHPNGFTEGRRFQNYYFSNVIGNPLETTIALHYLIFDGVLERYPDLKIFAVHGGGYLPAYSGRIDHAWGARKDSRGALPKPPTEYLRKMYFDNVVFTPHQLEYLVKVYGADKIVMGTDYPYDMADYDPVEHVMSVPSLSEQEVAKIAGGTAVELFSINR